MRFHIISLIAIIILCAACSGDHVTDSPINPPTTPALTGSFQHTGNAVTSHHNWGLWQITADPVEGTFDILPLRTGRMHVNVVPFLEPPAGAKLSISNLVFDGLICDVDVSLTHPFPGMSQYTGFDVAGIFIGRGTKSGFSDGALVMADKGETRLLNADGYTRWWNPVEFSNPGQPILRYRDGLLGNPHSTANFNCRLNGYKLFGDELEPEDIVTDVILPENKVAFSDGWTNARHYTIDFSGGVVFNYAVDANWEPPGGVEPFEPDDFPPEANRCEAWAVSITETENTLWNDGDSSGGNISLTLDIWDHYHADLNSAWLESPGNFLPLAASAIGGGEGYSTYHVDIIDATPHQGTIDILIGIESEVVGYWDVLPDNPVTAYFIYTAYVCGPSPTAPVAVMEATTPTNIPEGDTVTFDASASTGSPPLSFEWDFNGDDEYDSDGDEYTGDSDNPTHQFDEYGTYNVTVKVTNDYGEDISDAVAIQVGFDPDDTFVDGDYTGGDSDGTMEKPYLTVQDGMNNVLTDHVVHVDYLDGGGNIYDTAGLTLKSNVTLRGDNWNGGGPGKPKLDNTSGTSTISGGPSNFILEGFEIGLAEVAESAMHYGVNINGGGNVTVRHNRITDSVDDTGISGGVSQPIRFYNADNSHIEFNDIGPITYESDTPGEYVRCVYGLEISECDYTEVKNNFVHDFTIDYDGDGVNWGQIRVFMVHCYRCLEIDVHNNLICHVNGINDYDYRIEGMMMEGYSGPQEYHYYNNTIDNLDHSQSNGGFPLRGIFIYADNAPGSYINNTLISYFDGPGSWSSIQTYFSSPSNVYEITYSTAYSMDASTDYFYNLIEGDGITNYPGINPLYENNTTSPYDYNFQEGSGCEMGDPDFLDWDDTGYASGDPYESDPENRSRMGCFGGPDGGWDPYDI